VLSNRYLFAGANPVSFADDGHSFAGKDRTVQEVDDYLVHKEQVWVDDPAHYGGGFTYTHITAEPVCKTNKVCERSRPVGQFVDYQRRRRIHDSFLAIKWLL